MPQYHFGDVSLVLVDANRDVRSSVRTSLRLEGFGAVRDTSRAERAREWIEEQAPDLVIADSHSFNEDGCRLFHGIRHHEFGEDPFVPIIAVLTEGMPPQIRHAVDSGADHILVKPVSIGSLLERVALLIRKRKPFVVTCDYIGPDRRREPRPGPSAPLIEVPNALRAKATRSADAMALRRDIRRATAEINRRKMERDAFQISWLVERIVVHEESPQQAAHLNRLLETAEDLARRLAGTSQDHVSGLCRSLVQVAGNMMDLGAMPGTRDFKVLPHLAAAIRAAFPNDATAAIARDISDSLSRRAI